MKWRLSNIVVIHAMGSIQAIEARSSLQVLLALWFMPKFDLFAIGFSEFFLFCKQSLTPTENS